MNDISFSPEVRAALDELMAKEGVTEEEALRRAVNCLRRYGKYPTPALAGTNEMEKT